MIKVPMYRLRNSTSQLVGWITLENGQLSCEPKDDISLLGVLTQPGFNGKVVSPNKDPETWIKALPSTFHGSYLWAGQPEVS